jgi:hypothetical protein
MVVQLNAAFHFPVEVNVFAPGELPFDKDRLSYMRDISATGLVGPIAIHGTYLLKTIKQLGANYTDHRLGAQCAMCTGELDSELTSLCSTL